MNGEYKYWINIFNKRNWTDNIKKLSLQLMGKKVLLYCCGAYFDALCDTFNLSQLFDIVGISDLRFQKGQIETYKNFKTYSPAEIENLHIDCVIITSPNYENIQKSLQKEKIISKNTKIISLNFNNDDEIEIKQNYAQKITELKQKDKVKVAFIVEENTKWSYQFLYEQLKKDNSFEVLPIILFPIVTKNRVEYTQAENIGFFKKLNIEAIDYYDYEKEENKDIKDLNPDIVFYTQPWYLMNINHPKIVSKYALTCMVPYGYTTLASDNWGSNNVKEVYRSLWKFFSESEYHNSFYQKTCNMKNNLVAVGSLKFDYYKMPISPASSQVWKGGEAKARIIYAPHHSIKNNGLKMSNFDRDYEFFLDFAKNNPQYSFIFKPHPALKSMCVFENIMSEKDYDNYIAKWNNLENAQCYDKGNYFDIFKTSDCLITDCSSFLAEYYPTLKPIIFLNRRDRAPFDDFGNNIKQGFYELFNTDNIETLLNKLLIRKEDELFEIRKTILDKYFYIPEEMAYKLIYKYLR